MTNKENYFTALQKIGEKMVEKYIQNLVEYAKSMPRRFQAVIKAKGSHTKY